MTPSKKDWQLYCELLPGWQENYMAELDREYAELLTSDRPASVKFWDLDRRMKEDKKKASVRAELSKREMIYQLAELIQEHAVTFDDLREFSEETKQSIKIILQRP